MSREMRLCTVSMPYAEDRGVEGNLELALRRIEEAASFNPDLICLPETFAYIGVTIDKVLPEVESIPGPITNRLAEAARKHGCWIAAGTFAKVDGVDRNSCFFLDTDGEVRGIYHKMFPTLGEIDAGIVPGHEATVIDSPWGRIGAAICFDINFHEVMDGLGRNGAQLVLFPSYYHAGMLNSASCFANTYYLASAVVMNAETGIGGWLVDPIGQVRASASGEAPIVCAEINLDFVVAHENYNEQQIEELKKREDVDIVTTQRESLAIISAKRESQTAMDIVREMGIELRTDYFNRARQARNEALASSNVVARGVSA